MIKYKVNGATITFFFDFSFNDDNDFEQLAGIYCNNDGDFKKLAGIYFDERKKYFTNLTAKDNHSAEVNKKLDDTTESKVKISLDTAPLDDAIKKADNLIAKLKTAQLLINYFKTQA